jgi:hypothetical protein
LPEKTGQKDFRFYRRAFQLLVFYSALGNGHLVISLLYQTKTSIPNLTGFQNLLGLSSTLQKTQPHCIALQEARKLNFTYKMYFILAKADIPFFI